MCSSDLWDGGARQLALDTSSIMIDPSDKPRSLAGTDATEAAVCWDIANRLEGRLLAAGALVVLTRSQDSAQGDERERARLANEQGIDLVLSIKCDSHANPIAAGVASYYFGHEFSRSATGLRLAELLQEELAARTALRDCGAHPKTWDLLRATRMPAVRVDVGYVTSDHDSSVLSDPAARDRIAAAMYSEIGRAHV